MVRLRLKNTDRTISLPVALDLQAALIQSSTAITLSELIRVVVLEAFLDMRYSSVRATR